MKKLIAVYYVSGLDMTMIREKSGELFTSGVRISDWLEVDFPPIKVEEIEAQVGKIDKEIQETEERHAKALKALYDRKTDALSLVLRADEEVA